MRRFERRMLVIAALAVALGATVTLYVRGGPVLLDEPNVPEEFQSLTGTPSSPGPPESTLTFALC